MAMGRRKDRTRTPGLWIAWRTADSLALRGFLGLGLEEATPEHSTLSRTWRLIAYQGRWPVGVKSDRTVPRYSDDHLSMSANQNSMRNRLVLISGP